MVRYDLGHGASTCFLVERKSWAMFSSPKFFMYLLESKGNIRDSEKFFKIMYGSFQRAFSPDDDDNKDVIEFS